MASGSNSNDIFQRINWLNFVKKLLQ